MDTRRRLLTLTLLLLLQMLQLGVSASVSGGTVLPLVSSEGTVKSTAQMQAFLQSSVPLRDPLPVLALLDLSRGSSLALLKASMKADLSLDAQNGISLCLDGEKAVLYAAYKDMHSSKFSGSKATDFCCTLADCVVVVLPATDMMEVLQGHDQTLRRIAKKLSSPTCRAKSLLFLVDSTSALPSQPIESLSSAIQTHFSSVFEDTTGQVHLIDHSCIYCTAHQECADLYFRRASFDG